MPRILLKRPVYQSLLGLEGERLSLGTFQLRRYIKLRCDNDVTSGELSRRPACKIVFAGRGVNGRRRSRRAPGCILSWV
jgi:hypothetical protein